MNEILMAHLMLSETWKEKRQKLGGNRRAALEDRAPGDRDGPSPKVKAKAKGKGQREKADKEE